MKKSLPAAEKLITFKPQLDELFASKKPLQAQLHEIKKEVAEKEKEIDEARKELDTAKEQ